MIGVLWDWGGEFYFATVGLVCGDARLCGSTSIAVGVHLEDDGVVDEAVVWPCSVQKNKAVIASFIPSLPK